MNWTKFQTHGMAPEKAFESLCNQLFIIWSQEEYKSTVTSIKVVNGAGGDGGVESYAVLEDNSIVALQAKWFPFSISPSQISQIKNSICTAKKVRPEITRYIVCVPRDLASKAAKSKNPEDARWETLLGEISDIYPDLLVELWNETKIMAELQKPESSGVFAFWFKSSEITNNNIRFAFCKAKQSWLSTKYVPDLNTFGEIEKTISLTLGDLTQRDRQVKELRLICRLCRDYLSAAKAFLPLCMDAIEINMLLKDTSDQIAKLLANCSKMIAWYSEEKITECPLDFSAFDGDYEEIANSIHRHLISRQFYFHASDVIGPLRKLAKISLHSLAREFPNSNFKESLIILGGPGTGKTHGIGAVSEKLLSDGVHFPLIIRARNIPASHSWKRIIEDYLGLSTQWEEGELWQSLISMANRHQFLPPQISSNIKIINKIIIFVDGLDESSTHTRWVERIREANAVTAKYPQIRFCFTARPTAFEEKVDYARVRRLGETGDVPPYVLFDAYMKAYNISTQNNGWIKYSLTTPLALKIFCELNHNKTVTLSSRTEISMTELWRNQIAKIDEDYCDKCSLSQKNQYVFKGICYLAKRFVNCKQIERSLLVDELASELKVNSEQAGNIVDHLESYGVLSCHCKHGTGISPDIYFYEPGIQGYFDFAVSSLLLLSCSHPKEIDFGKYKEISTNTLHSLAIISIQKYGYLLTMNPTIDSVLGDWGKQELQFLALLHTDHTTAEQFKARIVQIMLGSSDGMITFTNRLVLPLSRDYQHPFGIILLDKVLNHFDKPAQRDALWSIPCYLRDVARQKWSQSEPLTLEGEQYLLSAEDTYDGCPSAYVWALSTVSNPLRKKYRSRLMEWAYLSPNEFYRLFLKFANVNDPQIKSDMYSILMCLIYDSKDLVLVKTAGEWILENVLHPEKIDKNRDISIRYFSVAIVRRAAQLELFPSKEVSRYLPPYYGKNHHIALSKDALNGSRLTGYSAISYDLSRYVLIDYVEMNFNSYHHKETKQFENLIEKIANDQPDFSGISVEQFVLSAAYAYLLDTGWNEREFYNFEKDETGEKIVGGVDCSIRGTHHMATHGMRSTVMTVCEKYIWQARNTIDGFLCDRLLFGDDCLAVTDYGLVDNFTIPAQEIQVIDPNNIPTDRPWHNPEPEHTVLEGAPVCAEDVITAVLEAPGIDWEKWILFKNADGAYNVSAEDLVALDMYSCFHGTAGVETCLLVNAILLDQKDVLSFVEAITRKSKKDNRVTNPMDWYGNIASACYITPKEVCWFPWKERYDASNVAEFPNIKIISAVDKCCYNCQEYGDVYYYLPSAPIREALGIVDSDGYRFFDNSCKVIAEHSISGEKWRTYQQYLLTDRPALFHKLEKIEMSLVWIMRERRVRSGNSKEQFGRFGAERLNSFVGFLNEGKFQVRKIATENWQYKE